MGHELNIQKPFELYTRAALFAGSTGVCAVRWRERVNPGRGGGRRVGFPHRMTLTWGMFGVQSQRRRSGCSQQLDDRPMTQAAAPRRAAGTGQPCLVCF